MNFIEINISCKLDFKDILMAEIASLDFDTFEETENGFKAYIGKSSFDPELIKSIADKYSSQKFTFQERVVAKENWNKTWENNYAPIFVDDQIVVCASFHSIEKIYPYQIIITPKMSFGTGHHETTQLMLSNQLKVNHKGMRVFDVGCGTGILAIMASKLGASTVSACDIDDWCVENAEENATLNKSIINVKKGTISELNQTVGWDILLANINKNILVEEVGTYYKFLTKNGILIVSGFYIEDVEEIGKKFAVQGLVMKSKLYQNNWASCIFEKH